MELYIAWLGSIKLKSRIRGQIVFCLTPNIDSTPDYCTVDTGALHYHLSLREKEGGEESYPRGTWWNTASVPVV